MYFTLAVSAATTGTCAALTAASRDADPRLMPLPGPARVAWRAPDGLAAVLHWGPASGGGARSYADSIWAEAAVVHARTGLARVDPVYLAEVAGAVVLSDRASWAAAVTGHLHDADPVLAGAFLSLGYPVGGVTPFRGVRALSGGRTVRAARGRARVRADREEASAGGGEHGPGPGQVASALIEAVRPLSEAELSLTGGKDSRLIAAALVAAGVPFRARTHGFASHPDVIVAGMIAGRLGLEHAVTEPAAPGTPSPAEVLGRLRATVLVSDGMLSAFENVGRPDPPASGGSGPAQTGGHGGELLRGGYAPPAWERRWSSAAGAELFRRMTTRRLGLLRPAASRAYLAALAPSAAALARGPLPGLDNFYLVNRAGRWSAAARQAYLLRSPLAQPFFADPVVRAARAVPLRDRLRDRLHRDVLVRLCPELLDIPLAGRPWQGEASNPVTVLTGSGGGPDWRRDLGPALAGFLRGYVLDSDAMFTVVNRTAAERALRLPLADPQAAWALATLAALMSGDWLNARDTAAAGPGPASPRVAGPGAISPGRTGSLPARSTAPPPRG